MFDLIYPRFSTLISFQFFFLSSCTQALALVQPIVSMEAAMVGEVAGSYRTEIPRNMAGITLTTRTCWEEVQV